MTTWKTRHFLELRYFQETRPEQHFIEQDYVLQGIMRQPSKSITIPMSKAVMRSPAGCPVTPFTQLRSSTLPQGNRLAPAHYPRPASCTPRPTVWFATAARSPRPLVRWRNCLSSGKVVTVLKGPCTRTKANVPPLSCRQPACQPREAATSRRCDQIYVMVCCGDPVGRR